MTTRGFTEKDFVKLANVLHECVELAINIQNEYGKKLVDFNKGLTTLNNIDKINNIKEIVNLWVSSYYFPDNSEIIEDH